ncbi:type VI secretion system Vgr family protein [Achromobacter xylosoxidans]|uniref:type VI secretion system Vgr family protein n=1 Tax=Alcaligenes xylosoxydans xylosoxydans TaxID=85698 RepID=UPI001040E2C1|nr:type VI secretion system Vgr family protein [Achromobacter xylosoxidans]
MIDRSSPPAGYSSLDVAALSQNARLLQVETPLGEALVVERLRLREGVSELFALTLDCLSASAELDVEPLLGKEISVSLLLADGGRRRWHAVVEGVDALGADGGLARYRLHAAPWLATLRLRRDSFVFQDKSVTDILTDVFADYPLAAFAFDIAEPLAPRPVRTQYRETDLDFVLRLMAEAGLSFRFDHQQGDSKADGGGARHRLVVFDARAAQPANPAASLRFHRSDATESEDSVTRFGAAREVRANAVTRVAWNDRTLLAHGAHAESALDAGALPPLEDYDYDGHGRHPDDAAAEQLANRGLQAHEARALRFEGGGSARQMMPGHVFALTQHDRYAQGAGAAGDELGGNRYTLLWVEHEAANNLGSQAAQALAAPDLEHGAYRNDFTAQPAAAALLPAWRARPTAPEGVTALVVTAQDASITTGRDLRVKVQFPWQRGERPLPGGLRHRSHGDDAGNAPGDDRSGTWLRVAGAQAGPNWGAHHLPRQGTEVVVEFLDGDIDQPVVVAQLYNDSDLPPWSAGVDGQANHPGTLSGWHSQGLDGQGHSQWLFDDTAGQVRTRLSSSIAASQLGLGYLVKQAADDASRGEWRGSGFELRSDAWTVVRSGQGMLLSANAREGARSTQADAQEALALLRGARNAAGRINDAATQRQARPLAANEQYDALIKAVDPKADGRYPGSVGGQQAVKAAGGERGGSDPVERIDGARMLIDAPSSMNLATPASAVLHASENLHVTAQADGHIAARQTFASASGRSTSLFVQDGGLRAIAANAPVSLQAHTDMLEMLAGQDITITSTTDSIEILANQRITLQAAGGAIVMDGGDIVFKGPGMFSVKGASHNLIGPASDAAALPALPSSQVGDPMLGGGRRDGRRLHAGRPGRHPGQRRNGRLQRIAERDADRVRHGGQGQIHGQRRAQAGPGPGRDGGQGHGLGDRGRLGPGVRRRRQGRRHGAIGAGFGNALVDGRRHAFVDGRRACQRGADARRLGRCGRRGIAGRRDGGPGHRDGLASRRIERQGRRHAVRRFRRERIGGRLRRGEHGRRSLRRGGIVAGLGGAGGRHGVVGHRRGRAGRRRHGQCFGRLRAVGGLGPDGRGRRRCRRGHRAGNDAGHGRPGRPRRRAGFRGEHPAVDARRQPGQPAGGGRRHPRHARPDRFGGAHGGGRHPAIAQHFQRHLAQGGRDHHEHPGGGQLALSGPGQAGDGSGGHQPAGNRRAAGRPGRGRDAGPGPDLGHAVGLPGPQRRQTAIRQPDRAFRTLERRPGAQQPGSPDQQAQDPCEIQQGRPAPLHRKGQPAPRQRRVFGARTEPPTPVPRTHPAHVQLRHGRRWHQDRRRHRAAGRRPEHLPVRSDQRQEPDHLDRGG